MSSKEKSSLLSIEDQFSFYGAYHTNPVNVAIHILCVPVIFFTGLVLNHNWPHPTWASVPVPLLNTTFDLNWISAVAIAYAAYFVLLEPVAGLSYAPILVGLGHLSNVVYDEYPAVATKYAGWAFGAAWVAQFVGHGKFEGRAPALFTSLVQSLVLAVFFVYLEVLFHFGYRPALHKRLQNRIGVKVAEYRRSKAAAKKVA